MVDVNFLKKINDTYGHEQGNIYLMNAVKLICAIFGTDNVYRIGGDEFVVILTDMMAPLGKYFVTEFDFEMKQKNSAEALQPWEKVSAAVGIAIYDAENDKTVDEVFKRADTLMYANKLAMKAARTD
jgi:diguanylate cyclase (GGDEF)-like protein